MYPFWFAPLGTLGLVAPILLTYLLWKRIKR